MKARGLLLLLMAAAGCSAQASELKDGEAAFRGGRYEEAIAIFQKHLASGDARAYRGLARALSEVGRYEEAEEHARAFVKAHPESPELFTTLGEALVARGRAQEAEEAFHKSVSGRASDLLTAELGIAMLLWERGDRDAAFRGFDRFIDVYNRSAKLSSEALTAVATACKYLGQKDPQLSKDALKAFDEAIAADPENPEPRVRLAELFLETYNSTDAQSTLKELLEKNPNHPRALLGMARCADFDGVAMALDFLEKTLTVNPNLVPARTFRARILLSHEDYTEAQKEIEKALAVNPTSSEALAVLAAGKFLTGDRAGFDEAERRALGVNAKNADFYVDVAEACVQNRLYKEAAGLAQKAVALEPQSWRALGVLGLDQLRLGEIEEARKNLETSFAGDPYNVWIKNTLDLLDTFSRYRETKSAGFRVLVDGKESELLAPYLTALGDEAYEKLAERYGYRPPTPLRVEVYPSHADFSVRTVGLAGLGALGVCFGNVLAIDSPSAREKGKFNWGSTFWHELTHVFTLGMTDHKVPRWLTEGLSVLEERRARPGWGDDISLDFLVAYQQEKLLPLKDLNDGFMRPRFPQQIAISYYQASLITELIERDYGFSAIRGILAGYKEGRATQEIFPRVLGVDLDAFDKKFDAYLKERFGETLKAIRVPESKEHPEGIVAMARKAMSAETPADPGDFIAQLSLGLKLYKEKKLDEAKPYLERAQSLFPDYASDDSPTLVLALIHKEKGELEKAAAELQRFIALNETNYQACLDLAEVRQKLGDRGGAAAALDSALYIYPFEAPVHTRLAGLYADLKTWPEAVRERRAVVALSPVDRAEAIYQLALAYYQSGNLRAARTEVLRALEVAPNFDRAQELLLKLQSATKGQGGKE